MYSLQFSHVTGVHISANSKMGWVNSLVLSSVCFNSTYYLVPLLLPFAVMQWVATACPTAGWLLAPLICIAVSFCLILYVLCGMCSSCLCSVSAAGCSCLLAFHTEFDSSGVFLTGKGRLRCVLSHRSHLSAMLKTPFEMSAWGKISWDRWFVGGKRPEKMRLPKLKIIPWIHADMCWGSR